MKTLNQILLTVLLLFGIIASWFILNNQLSLLTERTGQRQAVAECMRWSVPDAVVINGETYCIVSIEVLTSGAIKGARIALNENEMLSFLGEPNSEAK